MASDVPITIDKQVELMKKYVTFTKRKRMRDFLRYAGYFRASRYGKYLLSYTNVFAMKPSQDTLFAIYQLDIELKKIMYEACAKAEVQIRTAISNAVSLKTGDAFFYLNQSNYTPTRSERNKYYRERNVKSFRLFWTDIVEKEKNLRRNILKYPELREYRSGGERASKKIPGWAAFSYFEFGTIENIYKYLRGDLRKEVLIYGYSRGKYGKQVTNQMDTWLNGIRTLRNICAHHARIVGMQESIVLPETEESDILSNGEDFFSRLYALKKVMNSKDSEEMKVQLKRVIEKIKINVYALDILPDDWEERFDRIKYL